MNTYYENNRDKWKKYYRDRINKINIFCEICKKRLTRKNGTGRCQKHFSKETRENMSVAHTGKTMSDSAREKCKTSKRGKKNPMWRKTGPLNPNWKGGSKNYPNFYYQTDWEKLRVRIYQRDKWLCQICGVHCVRKSKTWKRIQCHHKIPYEISKDNSQSNLTTLCARCHTSEHAKLRAIKRGQEIKKLSGQF